MCILLFVCQVRYSTGLWYSAEYWSFQITDSSTDYTLSVSGFSGDAVDAMQTANNQKFLIYHQASANNGASGVGGWWQQTGNTFSASTLNIDGPAYWSTTSAAVANVMASRMMIRRIN